MIGSWMNSWIYSKRAKKNAVKYIKEKYGFKAKVTSSVCQQGASGPLPIPTSTLTGEVYVYMEHEGKQFIVLISGDDKTTRGYDNYQADIINKAIREQVTNILGEIIEEVHCYGHYAEHWNDKEYGLVDVFYDGENLKEVLTSTNMNRAVISVVNKDLTELDSALLRKSFGKNLQYAIVNYRSHEDYKKAGKPVYNLDTSLLDMDVDKYALYINDYLLLKGPEVFYYEFGIGTCDDFYYCFTKGTYCKFTKTDTVDLSPWIGNETFNERRIFDVYAMNTDARIVNVYVPIEKLKSDDRADIVMLCTYEGKKIAEYNRSGKVGEEQYLTAKLYTFGKKDICFTVVRK